MKKTSDIKERHIPVPIIIREQTWDRIRHEGGKNWHEALLVYQFLVKTANFQVQNQPYCNKIFIMNGMDMSARKVAEAIKVLEGLKLIERIFDRKGYGYQDKTYVKVNYMVKINNPNTPYDNIALPEIFKKNSIDETYGDEELNNKILGYAKIDNANLAYAKIDASKLGYAKLGLPYSAPQIPNKEYKDPIDNFKIPSKESPSEKIPLKESEIPSSKTEILPKISEAESEIILASNNGTEESLKEAKNLLISKESESDDWAELIELYKSIPVEKEPVIISPIYSEVLNLLEKNNLMVSNIKDFVDTIKMNFNSPTPVPVVTMHNQIKNNYFPFADYPFSKLNPVYSLIKKLAA